MLISSEFYEQKIKIFRGNFPEGEKGGQKPEIKFALV